MTTELDLPRYSLVSLWRLVASESAHDEIPTSCRKNKPCLVVYSLYNVGTGDGMVSRRAVDRGLQNELRVQATVCWVSIEGFDSGR